jgi:putative addiction module CopG family antidote
MQGVTVRCSKDKLTRTGRSITKRDMTLSIDLNNPSLEAMVKDKIASGAYRTASAMVEDALARMELADKKRAEKLAQLRSTIQESIASGSALLLDGESIKQRGRERLANLCKN